MKRMMVTGVLALGAVLLVLGTTALAAAALRGNGFPPEQAGAHGVVLGLFVLVPLLMLAGGAMFRSRLGFAAVLLGGTAGMLGITWLYGAEMAGSVRVAGLGVVLALLVREAARLVCALRLGDDAARGVCGLLVFVSMGSHFWSGALAQGDWGSRLATWGSVPAMASFVHGTFRMAYLPEVYRTWLGPVVPYPGSVWTVYAVYGGMALVAGCLAWWIGVPDAPSGAVGNGGKPCGTPSATANSTVTATPATGQPVLP